MNVFFNFAYSLLLKKNAPKKANHIQLTLRDLKIYP